MQSPAPAPRFGITLPNRGVLFGVTTPTKLLEFAERADDSGLIDTIWVGDSIFGKPRLESVVLLAGLAGRTKRVRLAPGCFASFILRDPLQLAYQWASLDALAEGRTVFVACLGGVGPGAGSENQAFAIQPGERVARLLEGVTILKRTWTESDVTHDGRFYHFANITVEPRPAASPRPPIWLANNVRGRVEESDLVQRSLRRIARHFEGWQSTGPTPEEMGARLAFLRDAFVAEGRDPDTLDSSLYFNINLNPDYETAIDETTRFLELYYGGEWPRERVVRWTAAGTPEQAIEHLQQYYRVGVKEVTVRITSWDQDGQFDQVLRDVIPAIKALTPA
jgi:alkanesulfonate monooxygenase SsuD/methylene tetrahydromethanopterin reductase-like flavin-dependent oxidoreductase (luciferase family)